MTGPVEITVVPGQFGPVEQTFARAGGTVVSGFRYGSGVAALRILNGAGEVIALPHAAEIAAIGGSVPPLRTATGTPR